MGARVSSYHALLQGCYCAPGLIVVMRFRGESRADSISNTSWCVIDGELGETLGWNLACFYSAY